MKLFYHLPAQGFSINQKHNPRPANPLYIQGIMDPKTILHTMQSHNKCEKLKRRGAVCFNFTSWLGRHSS